MQSLAALLPDPTGLKLEAITLEPEEQRVHITVAAAQQSAICPRCGLPSERIHSRYWRTLADLPWAGLSTRLLLQVRRWFCDQVTCPRRIFAERLPSIVPPRGRRTKRLATAQQRIGLALGGAAGARLAADLAMPAGIDLLLTLVRQAPVSIPASSPHVGIDDWAKRKAHHYGTIIVNLDTGQPITLLDDHSAEQVEAWLREHPEKVDCTPSTGPHGADASPIWCKLFSRGGAQWARPRKRTAVSSS
jgi:transposase